MSRIIKIMRLSVLLLLIVILALPASPPQVKAQGDSISLWLGLMTPDAPGTLCIGKRIVLEYYVVMLHKGAPPLIPRAPITVDLSAQLGKVAPSSRQHASWIWNQTLTSNFSYTAQKAGKESITIKASMGGYSSSIQLNLVVRKCKASVSFNHQQTLSQEMVVIENTYSGSGTIQVDDNNQISGNGTQEIWGNIQPYSFDGGSCVQGSPWEGSSAFSFSGEMTDDGDILASMFLEPLDIPSTTLTCSDADYTGSMPFPGYTYGECTVELTGFDFDAESLDVNFNCPGQEPYTLTIYIVPRSEE